MADPSGDLFLAHRAQIESVIRFVCRRRHLQGEHAEEFAAEVRLRLLQSNGEVLRKFQGRSSLQTYLTVVIDRLALDYQVARWGRWRPSQLARTHGTAGIRLEQLVVRDGVPIDDAVTTVAQELPPVDRSALAALAARFPMRARRHYLGEEILQSLASDGSDAERLLTRADEEARFTRVTARLRELLGGLAPAERLLLQFRYERGMKVADIARLQQIDQKRLYRTLTDILVRLREALEAEGVDVSTVRDMLDALVEDGPRREAARPVRLYEGNTP
jgi:RNA polymerase sigma factor (sigma-70 family)